MAAAEKKPRPTTAEIELVVLVDDVGQITIGLNDSKDDPWARHATKFREYNTVLAHVVTLSVPRPPPPTEMRVVLEPSEAPDGSR